jgi:hypothetical protein
MDLQEVECVSMVGFDIIHFSCKFIEQYQIIALHSLLLIVNSPICFCLTYWTLCSKLVLNLLKWLDFSG